MLYICTKFCEILTGIKVIERTLFLIWKITKGNNSPKNVGGVTIFTLCMSSGHFYISTKFCEIILNGIKVIERTLFLYGKL